MIVKRLLPLLAIIAGAMFPSSVRAQMIIGDRKDVKLEILHLPRNQTIHGYDSFWFQITNLSKSVPHTVTLTVPRTNNIGQLRSIRRSVEVKPGESAPLCLWYPPLRLQGWDVEIKLDGRVLPAGLGQNYTSDRGMYQWTQKQFYLLASPNANSQVRYQQNIAKGASAESKKELDYRQTDLGPLLKNQISWHTGSPFATPNRQGQGHEVVSRHWLSYSKYDGVVFSADEWKKLPEEIREGVLRYVECGGALLIQGAWTPPAHWQRFQNTVGRMAGYHVGFGECLVMPESDANKWQGPEWRYLAESWSMSATPFHVYRTAGAAHATFKVVDDVEIPVRGLFGLMVGFVILIGPVNLYVLSRWKQRIWLLLTVPAVSTVTCLAVLAYMLATEGLGSQSRVEAVTFLDENMGRAATVGWIGIYANVTPSAGLSFTEDTELTPQWDTGQYRSASARTLDWTNGQRLQTGWITPRVPTLFLARKSEERGEKLVVRKNSQSKWTVSNPFEKPIRSIQVATMQGKIFGATDVAAKGEGVLENKEYVCNPLAKGKLRELFWTSWLTGADTLAKSPELYLQPGCYVAVFDSSPFLEDGMASVDRRQARGVVFGVMKEPVNEN